MAKQRFHGLLGPLLFVACVRISDIFLNSGYKQSFLLPKLNFACRNFVAHTQRIQLGMSTDESADESGIEAERKRLFENVAGIESETKRRTEEKTKRQGEATETLRREFSATQNEASKGFLKGATNPLRLLRQNDISRLMKQVNQANIQGQSAEALESDVVPADVETAVAQVDFAPHAHYKMFLTNRTHLLLIPHLQAEQSLALMIEAGTLADPDFTRVLSLSAPPPHL